jgi:hypothetical protein
MSNTKREPLLSDADLGYVKDTHIAEQVRDTYEAARAKDAELIQQLVDALANLRDIHEERAGREPLTGMDELEAAEAAGFKPSEP